MCWSIYTYVHRNSVTIAVIATYIHNNFIGGYYDHVNEEMIGFVIFLIVACFLDL